MLRWVRFLFFMLAHLPFLFLVILLNVIWCYTPELNEDVSQIVHNFSVRRRLSIMATTMSTRSQASKYLILRSCGTPAA
jgi:hypothetical protein